jgi:hypothetical protein
MPQSIFFIMGLFLYFPEDKREYIPAGLTMAIFLIFAILTMRFIIVYNRREVQKAKELEEQLKKEKIID